MPQQPTGPIEPLQYIAQRCRLAPWREIHFDNQPSRIWRSKNIAHDQALQHRVAAFSAQRSAQGTKRLPTKLLGFMFSAPVPPMRAIEESGRSIARIQRVRRKRRPATLMMSQVIAPTAAHRSGLSRRRTSAAEIPIPELKREPDRQGPGKNSNQTKAVRLKRWEMG
jgi:hypothetical protein